MKKIIILCLLCLFCLNTYSQKCVETVDPITNEKKAEFNFVGAIIASTFKYEAISGKATLTKEFTYSGAINLTLPAGSEIFFKLENGEILKFKTQKESSPKMYSSAYGVQTGYNMVLGLSKEDLNKLAASPLILIRIPKITEEGFYDLDTKHYVVKKNKKPLMKGAACISGYL